MKTSFMLAFASQGFAVAFGYMFVGLCLVALVARWMWKNEEAKKSGETIVVAAWAKYCGTCKKQKVVLDQAEKDFKDVLFLYYNHPKMKDIAKYLKIDYRSTILVYKGNEEVSAIKIAPFK